MKIALIGYGKMGKTIERIARNRGHEIVKIIDVDNREEIDSPEFRSADVAIEFTAPAAAEANCREALAQGVKVVSGSTGWADRIPEIKAICTPEAGGTFFWSSNYSLGVNLFFALNSYLAKLMEGLPQYTPYLTETHHIHKLDHPSGTAISLAEGIIAANDRIDKWSESPEGERSVTVSHIRLGETPGTHTITWDSPVDSISITHEAKSREGFALGAVIAAEWVAGQKGFLTMDMLMKQLLSAGAR